MITGASAGVGRATARRFAASGAKIGLLARGVAGLEAAKEEVERLGGEAVVLVADVADAARVEEAAEVVESRFGPIDVWINNAMVSVFSPVREMTPEDYRRVTEVTYLGYVYGTLAALKRMLPRNRGMIVQVGSALAYRGIPLQSAYCAAKHAIQGFNDSLHCELLHDNSEVKLTMVQMPALNTPQFQWVKSRLRRKPQPVPPIYQPEIAAEAIYHAAHHYRREWHVGGSAAIVIQGNKFAAGIGDHYLARQGYDAQQHNGIIDDQRPNNLYEPVDAESDYRAHGEFDERAHRQSLQLWASQGRDWIVASGIAGAVTGALQSGVSGCFKRGITGLGMGLVGSMLLGAARESHSIRSHAVEGDPSSRPSQTLASR